MSTRKLINWELVLVTVALLVLLVAVPLARINNDAPIGESQETYFVLNTYLDSTQSSLYSLITGWVTQYIGLSLSIFLLPMLFGVISVILGWRLLSVAKVNSKIRLYTLVVVATAPAFLHAFVGFSVYQLLLVCVLWLLYSFYIQRKDMYLSLFLLLFVQPFVGLCALVVIIYYFSDQKKNKNALFAGVIGVLGLLLSKSITFGVFQNITIDVNDLFAFFGSNYGFSLFILLLGAYAIIQDAKKTSTFIKIVRTTLLLLAIVSEPIRFIAVIILSFYAAKGFYLLENRKWVSESVGQLTLVLFICILVFSSTVVVKEQISSFPYAQQNDLIEVLREHNVSTILTDPRYGEYYVYEGFSVYAYERRDIHIQEAERIFASQSLLPITPVFEEYAIDTIIVDEAMKNGRIWQRADEGLLFVLLNSKQFELLYTSSAVDVYKYVPISSS